jgi:hypothetical protein
VLGQGFHAFDLVCYAIGVALGVALELAALRRRGRSLSSGSRSTLRAP